MRNIKRRIITAFSLFLSIMLCLAGCGNDTHGTISTADTQKTSGTTATTLQTTAPTVKPANKKRIAITFDDGPHNIYTKAIADELAKYGAHATFFVVGNRVDGTEYRGGSTLAYLVQNGHEIGIHGYTHEVHYNKCTDEEFEYELGSTLNAIRKYAQSYTPKLMRPIGGSITSERISACEYSVVTWNIDSEDWKHKYKSGDTDEQRKEKIDAIVENVMSSIKEGSIVLMHDIYESTYDAFVIIMERLYADGYEVVTVSELIGDPKPGTKYSYIKPKDNEQSI